MSKILVVDDDPSVRSLIRLILDKEGYEIFEADHGALACSLAIATEPDVILLDVMMPNMSGFEVLQKLRENPTTQGVTVILLTALSASKGESIGMSLGVDHYINKPWGPGIVEAAVNVALREAAR